VGFVIDSRNGLDDELRSVVVVPEEDCG
jgi:hypothetical protein